MATWERGFESLRPDHHKILIFIATSASPDASGFDHLSIVDLAAGLPICYGTVNSEAATSLVASPVDMAIARTVSEPVSWIGPWYQFDFVVGLDPSVV